MPPSGPARTKELSRRRAALSRQRAAAARNPNATNAASAAPKRRPTADAHLTPAEAQAVYAAMAAQSRPILTPAEITNQRALMLAMIAWITDELTRLESMLPDHARTLKPQPSTPTPTIEAPKPGTAQTLQHSPAATLTAHVQPSLSTDTIQQQPPPSLQSPAPTPPT